MTKSLALILPKPRTKPSKGFRSFDHKSLIADGTNFIPLKNLSHS